MMMKASVAVVTFFILFSSVLTSKPGYQPQACCTRFYQKKLPAHLVQSFRDTDNLCPKRAVIITMTTNRDICVDPSREWVKKLVNVPTVKRRSTLTQNS
ncbi:C-C motif chemokine 13-like [Oryzias melastigma]|uniref:C-C motif chemokine 13-like n=1 Tax=Oryzias melastigma TaxID=30732 RepID=UPI000CF80B2D|nr:C-C motif chemokine 13-like [Oryzias melastigma]XP_036066390.1 C-C motif chemokine 13-like [Oryzias melastigma]